MVELQNWQGGDNGLVGLDVSQRPPVCWCPQAVLTDLVRTAGRLGKGGRGSQEASIQCSVGLQLLGDGRG